MKFLDVAANPRIAHVLEWTSLLGRLSDPWEILSALATALPGRSGPRIYAELAAVNGGSHYTLRRLLDAAGRPIPFGSADAPCGFLDQVLRTPMPKLIHDLDLAADPFLPASMATCRSAMAMPIFVGGAPQGWVILFDPAADGFTPEELAELALRTSLVSTALRNLETEQRLFEANLKIQREISALAAIQRSLLPENLPALPGLSLAASYETVGQAGGDLYDVVSLGDHRWALCVGDVSGHGLAAAVVMAMIHAILRAYPQVPRGPADIVRHTNRHLSSMNIGNCFVSLLLAFYDPASRSLTYCRAGHPPALLANPSDPASYAYLDAVGDVPLGINPEADFTESSIILRPGQLLLLYTDGVTEAKNATGEFFDRSGLERAIADAGPDAPRLVQRLRELLLHHSNSADPADDQTLLAACVTA